MSHRALDLTSQQKQTPHSKTFLYERLLEQASTSALATLILLSKKYLSPRQAEEASFSMTETTPSEISGSTAPAQVALPQQDAILSETPSTQQASSTSRTSPLSHLKSSASTPITSSDSPTLPLRTSPQSNTKTSPSSRTEASSTEQPFQRSISQQGLFSEACQI